MSRQQSTQCTIPSVDDDERLGLRIARLAGVPRGNYAAEHVHRLPWVVVGHFIFSGFDGNRWAEHGECEQAIEAAVDRAMTAAADVFAAISMRLGFSDGSSDEFDYLGLPAPPHAKQRDTTTATTTACAQHTCTVSMNTRRFSNARPRRPPSLH